MGAPSISGRRRSMWPQRPLRTPPTTRPGSWSWLLLHPVFWVSVMALVLNDQVLKWSYPGPLTGKLSDVAGVVMVATVMVALSGRVRLALMVTAALFGLLKTVPVVAVWAVPVFGGRTLTDPTDLVAVAFLVPLGWWLWRCRDRSHQVDGAGMRAWGTVAKVGGVFVAVLATSATSCYSDPFGQLGVAPDGTIIEGTADGTEQARLMLPIDTEAPLQPERNDAGDYMVWEWTDGPDIDLSPSETRACTDDGTCVEIRGLSIVEIGPGGAEEVVLDYTDRREAIDSQLGSCSRDLGERFPDVVSNGEVVVVAMGPVGAMVRTPDGEWLPTGLGEAVPSLAEHAERDQAVGVVAWVLPFLAGLAGLLFVVLYPTRTGARISGILIAVVGWLSTMFLLFVWQFVLEGAPGFALAVSIVMSFLIVTSCLLLGLVFRSKRPAPAPPPQFY